MEFVERQLEDTWFGELDLSAAGIEQWRVPKHQPLGWKAAVNSKHKVLFTQLLSNSAEMRDRIYYYLLAIGSDVLLIQVNEPDARILPSGAHDTHSPETVWELANTAAMVVTLDKKPFRFVRQ